MKKFLKQYNSILEQDEDTPIPVEPEIGDQVN